MKKSESSNAYKVYCKKLVNQYSSGDAGEHAYRPALQELIESFSKKLRVTNDPVKRAKGNRGSSQNKPDFIVVSGETPIGFIETKDINVDLDEVGDSNQISRYCKEYPNLILTDYLEFRRYVKGELRGKPIKIGRTNKKNNEISYHEDAEEKLTEFFEEFLLEETFSVSSPQELANRLASLTRQLKKLVKQELDVEEDSVRLHKLMIAFRKVLLADLDVEKFSDMFAQTLAYGFFAARVHYDGKGEFSRRTAATILPKTNPFLRKVFAEFANESLPDSLIGAVDEIVELLAKTNITSVLAHFGEQGREDPVVHFYESFLGAYDPEMKKSMGVFYTPDPVVTYMVRSLDEILTSNFERKKGLADDKTLILDPALGTGSFLHKVVEHIHSKVQKGSWDSYVSDTLLERIFGFEILMAPYAVAHLNLGIQLQNTGYKFEKDQRLGVYLTNTLEETAKRSEVLFSDWLSEEAEAAAKVKRDLPIMVVLGNPPYSGVSANKNKWIEGLLKGTDTLSGQKVASYFEVDGQPLNEKKHWLNDDYVKFIRFGQWRVNQTGHGVLAFVTNHGFLDNPTFRGMRNALTNDFDEIYVLDLHGNSKKKESCPNGSKDQNVFDIQQGVSICFMMKHQNKVGEKKKTAKVYRADLWGLRKLKYDWLSKNSFKTTPFKKVEPRSPFYTFTHQNHALGDEYNTGVKVTEIFTNHNSGMVTACDSLAIQFSKEDMWETVKSFSRLSPSEAKTQWDLGGNRDWKVEWAQKDLRDNGLTRDNLKKILYRPFDSRWTYYTGNMKGFVCNPRNALMQHMLDGSNIGLVSARSNKSKIMDHFFVTDALMETKAGESTTQSTLFPLFLIPEGGKGKRAEAQLNLTDIAQWYIEEMCGKCDSDTALKFFHYMYAICNSKSYRTKYVNLIKQDYPRIQFCSDKTLFNRLAKLGAELVQHHLLKDNRLEGGESKFPVKGTNAIDKVKYIEKDERLYINSAQYFTSVTKDDFEFTVGGYPVLEKWLKYRQKGPKLDHTSIAEFEKIIESVKRTQSLMKKVDEAISDSGGWPLKVIKMPIRKAA